MSGDFWGSKLIEVKQSEADALSARVHAVVADAATVLARPANRRFIAFQILADGFWLKPGYHPTRTFVDGDVSIGTDQIEDTTHGFTSGDGPYQLQSAEAAMTATTSVVIANPAVGTLTRTVGSWLAEGFVVGQTITISGSASNEGDEVIASVSATVIGTVGAMTPEAAQTDLVITSPGALPTGLELLTDYWVGVVSVNDYKLYGNRKNAINDVDRANVTAITAGGIHTIAAMAAAAPAATNTDGQGALFLTATATAGRIVTLSMPEKLTVLGDAGTSSLVYWYLP